jgi:hypothetical protein
MMQLAAQTLKATAEQQLRELDQILIPKTGLYGIPAMTASGASAPMLGRARRKSACHANVSLGLHSF